MKNLLNRLLEAARCFSLVDFAVFKVSLLSIGVLLGTYFAGFFGQYIAVVWVVAALSLIYLLMQLGKKM